jgi:hypothetical protein
VLLHLARQGNLLNIYPQMTAVNLIIGSLFGQLHTLGAAAISFLEPYRYSSSRCFGLGFLLESTLYGAQILRLKELRI